jgi:hypothetical protein
MGLKGDTMSTRCTINFTHGENVVAKVYRHSDGYPDTKCGVLADLQRFFADVEAQAPNDTRFNDPSYLAAKFVVWQAGENARTYNPATGAWEPAPPLRFLGVGVLMEDPGDIDYTYTIDCGEGILVTKSHRPTVTYKEVQ